MGKVITLTGQEVKSLPTVSGITVPLALGREQGILFVAEQPGFQESRALEPLVGPSGKELLKWLARVGIPREFVSKTNVINLFGPKLETFYKKNEFTEQGKAQCARLYEEICRINPKVIVCLGTPALHAVTGRIGISKWRGSILSALTNDIPVVGTYHPSFVLRENTHFRWVVYNDLMKAKDIWLGTYQKTYSKTETLFSFDRVLELFDYLNYHAQRGELIGFDIEVGGNNPADKKVSAFSLAHGHTGFCIPLVKPDYDRVSPVFNLEEETAIFQRLHELLTTKEARIITQGGEFDYTFILQDYGIYPTCKIEDTMIAQHTLMPEFKKSLAMIVSIWTDQPYYKDDGKDFLTSGTAWERFWEYSALDALMCLEAFPKQFVILKKQENVEAYERQTALIKPITDMMERGIRVDVEQMIQTKEKLQKELTEVETELLSYTGPDFNYASPKQVCDYFYNIKGCKPYKNKAGNDTADKLALKRLARKTNEREAFREASLILDARKKSKLLSSYLHLDKIDKDSRLRCSYNPVGTRYTRMSSSANIRGTGMNLQNWPHSMLGFLKADPGYAIVSYDLSQAENRIVAYVAGAGEMIKCFEEDTDVHSKTAEFIMSVFYGPEVASMMSVRDHAPLGNGEAEWRDWGKRANHGLNYDLGYHNFSLLYEIELTHARKIVAGYNMLYPEVENRFRSHCRKMIRETGVITNLFNRKIRFFAEPCDHTYKASYACIPQGSVGDQISEWGMLPLHYNPLFKECELLMQVHDRLTWQVPIAIGWQKIAEQILEAKRLAEQELTAFMTTYHTFRIPADFYVGRTCNTDCTQTGTKYKSKELNITVEDLAAKLSNDWESKSETTTRLD